MASSIIDKAQAAAASAKLEVKRLKGLLKQARRVSKAAKQLLKDARRKTKAETAADAKAKGAVAKSAVAKSAPTPAVPAAAKAARGGTVPKVSAITVRKPKASRSRSAPTLRSASEVAKSVIERLQSPPPALPPEPNIPPPEAVLPDSGSDGASHQAGEQAAER